MSRSRLFTSILIITVFVLTANGCSWGRRDAARDLNDPWDISVSQNVSVTPVAGLGGTGEAASIKLVNTREFPVSSEGLAATGFDGPVTWSRDSQHVAIQLSNMTVASTQVQIINVGNGQREAVVGGYDLHWDETIPGAIIFTQHQYYGEPDYGSHEVTRRVSQNDLFAARVFNESKVPSEIIGDSAGAEEVVPEEIPRGGDEIIWSKNTPDGRFTFFTKESPEAQPLYVLKIGDPEDPALLLTEAEAVIGSFDLSADGRKIIYQKIKGERDEFGNWSVTDDKMKFYIADINY